MVCYSEEVGPVKLKGVWELSEYLVDTVQELEEHWGAFIGTVRVTESVLEFVPK